MSRAKNIAKAKKIEKRQQKSANKNILDGKAAYKKRRGTALGWTPTADKSPRSKGQAKGAFGKAKVKA